ncbi:hypothetical protein EUC41_09110 [Achromobacter denitrificans]|uniref:hypothetical protein n=1 Tax=Achromobacter denitrificans TaxID=32002 RepID=UPI00240E073C|nr:hypothetical protein [Achromobacter denitrificans]WFC66460.1 hypothetical protein EUC41_09110 [Achromobacter denitrificans]
MTLDDLKKIDSNAAAAKREAEELRSASQALAGIRNADPVRPSDLTSTMANNWRYGSHLIAREEFFDVLLELMPEVLRIAELRLEARARAASARNRALAEQVRSFFDEEVKQ